MGALIERLRRDPLRTLAWGIATGFGTGLSPVAPGTAGSLAGAALYYFSPFYDGALTYLYDPLLAVLYAVVIVTFFVGIWAANTISSPENPDPGYIVWDEFVGMWTTCLFLPKDLFWLSIAFVAFRLFDVVKPFPIRRLERLHGGLGIMADDLLAGVYGAVLCHGLLRLYWYIPVEVFNIMGY